MDKKVLEMVKVEYPDNKARGKFLVFFEDLSEEEQEAIVTTFKAREFLRQNAQDAQKRQDARKTAGDMVRKGTLLRENLKIG